MKRRSVLLGVLLAALALVTAGCVSASHARAAGVVDSLAVRPVVWNAAGARVGHVTAVADGGSVVALFGDAGATVFSSGAALVHDTHETRWSDAGVVPGADGVARWIIGIDEGGHLRYLHGLSRFEDVSSRFGLEGARVRSIAVLDERRTAFLLDGEIAVADGRRVTRYSTGPVAALAASEGKAALVAQDRVLVLEGGDLGAKAYALPGVQQAALGSDGRVYAATARAVYASTKDGDLTLVYDAQADTIHGLVASAGRVWFADGSELGNIVGDRVAETRGAGIAPGAGLRGSPSGDVWVLGAGEPQRFRAVEGPGAGASARPEGDMAAAWSVTLEPVFARACASCHSPTGVSGTDLSTSSGWQSEREAIRRRVIVTRSMPPEGHPLSDADRAAIAAWASAPQ